MQSCTPSHWQQIFKDKTQDSSSVCSESEENDLPVEVHDDHDNDRGLKPGSLSLQAKSIPGAPTEEDIAVDSINRLPVELLSEIFLVCAHTLGQSELDSMKYWGDIPPHHYRLMIAPNAVPYTVSSVCKRWRSIGLSTPELWSKFTIPRLDYEPESFMVALRTWLKRSKNQPLQFTCIWVHHIGGGDVYMELFKNIHRWHITYFENPYASTIAQEDQWFKNDGLKAENLDTLEFGWCNEFLNIAFERFPSLRRLRIHPHCLAAEEARGLSLTHLALTELKGDVTTFFSYLRQFPSLISFEAPVNGLNHDWSNRPFTLITYTTLTELTITECNSDTISLSNILANLHLPSIRRLCLKYQPYFAVETLSQNAEMADAINDFIRRHESTFTDFELSGLGTSSDEMIEILRMFPKYLTSYQSRLDGLLTDKCVKRLTLDPSDPSQDLVPNLSSLSLYVGSFVAPGPSGDLLAEMILSRWARNPHTTFKLRTCHTGLNPLLDSRIARRVQYNPGLLLLY